MFNDHIEYWFLALVMVLLLAILGFIIWLDQVPEGKYEIISLKRAEVQEGKYRFKKCLVELKDSEGKIETYKKEEQFCLDHNIGELLEVK